MPTQNRGPNVCRLHRQQGRVQASGIALTVAVADVFGGLGVQADDVADHRLRCAPVVFQGIPLLFGQVEARGAIVLGQLLLKLAAPVGSGGGGAVPENLGRKADWGRMLRLDAGARS